MSTARSKSARHVDIGDHRVELLESEELESVDRMNSNSWNMAKPTQSSLEHPGIGLIIIDDENPH